ncbi:hypothetical protein ACP4OV_004532 [Aristida adscensionis]
MSITTSLVLTFLVVLLQTIAVTMGRGNCSSPCDFDQSEISYPFGYGPECSLPGFNLTCKVRKDKTTRILLGNLSIETPTRLSASSSPFPTITADIGYFVKMIPGVRDYSVRWQAPGRPFAISGSSNMSLFVVGCGVQASLFNVDSGVEMGNCSVVCIGDQIMEMLPEGLCFGIGCCVINITVDLRAFTLNISRIGQSARVLEQVSAFIAGRENYGFLTSHLGFDLSASFPAKLSWAIPFQPNCELAMEESYACVARDSRCEDSPIGGYICHCSQGTYGNPYVINGCVRGPDYGFVQPRVNCPTSCGNVSIPFPFGMEVGCFARIQLYLACNPGPRSSPPFLQIDENSMVTDISIDDGIMRVAKSSDPSSFVVDMDPPLYSSSGQLGLVKWAVDNVTCKDALAFKVVYICSSYSECVDVTDDRTLHHIGYRCKCSMGFEGNPYLKDGCTDINECEQPDRYTCNGICQNTFGNYTCTGCPRGSDFNVVTRKCKQSTIILGVTIGLSSGGGILFLAAVAAILTRRWKRSVQKRLRKRYFRKNKGILLEQLLSYDQNASDGMKIFSLDELEKATNNFDHDRVVGRGGHGTVYKGILIDQRVVAIKRSKLDSSTEIEQFINEVSILSQINHRNVVKLHGCCLEAEVPLLVYEFISNGTLYELLHSERDGALQPLSWETRLRIAVEVAGALTYLHSAASMSILHRDIKCMNVLLNDSYTAKVSDFGASRSIPIDQTHLVTAVQGTFGYLDPEYYYTGQLNEKSDVYSFGVILLELLMRKRPILKSESGEKQNLSNYFLWAMGERRPLGEVVDGEILGEMSEEAITGMAGLAAECLRLTRGERPTMKDVEMRLQMLRGRHAATPPATGSCEAMAAATVVSRRHGGGAIPVPAGTAHHGSRQYSLEQEFVSSSRVPR